MGFNIGEVTGFGGGPSDWTLTVDLNDPSVTSVTGDFDQVSLFTGQSVGEADSYVANNFSANFGTYTNNFTLDADGIFSFDIDRQALFQSGSDQTVSFTIVGTSGANSDDDTVTVTLLICVATGTLIDTASGARPVESLVPGDRVHTHDNGLQRLRWIGSRALSDRDLAAQPHLRPIRIAAGALGQGRPLRDLFVSPQHRVLLSDWRAQLLFGQDEILIPAKALVNGRTITVQPGTGGIEYHHLLFENHEVILTEGAPTESFHPCDYSLGAIDRPARDELFRLFPELRTDAGFGPTARPVARVAEARLLSDVGGRA